MKWYHYLMNIDVIATIILVLVILYFVFTERKKKSKYKFQGLQKDWRNHLPKYDHYSETGDHEGTVKVTKNFNDEYKPLFQKPKRKKKINKHEERCREIFQNIFRTAFVSTRPDWLKNPVTNRNLELDGFAPDIETPVGKGLAFEYDGEQHSKYNTHFHNDVSDFKYQVKKDTYKDLKCKERGILLVRIPHFVDYYDLDRYITEKLKKMGVFPGNNLNQNGYSSRYRTPTNARSMYT